MSGREEERARALRLILDHPVNPVENNPTDAWIVRVQGKEYGPVDLEELRAWKQEGRLVRENEIREPGSERWIPAGELPELFADETPAPNVPPTIVRQSTLGEILVRTWQIYRERFGQFLGLSALVIVPSLCAQLSGAASCRKQRDSISAPRSPACSILP